MDVSNTRKWIITFFIPDSGWWFEDYRWIEIHKKIGREEENKRCLTLYLALSRQKPLSPVTLFKQHESTIRVKW